MCLNYFIWSKIHKFTMWGTVCRPTASKYGSCSNAFMEATGQEIIHFDGKYHDNTSELAQTQYRDLVDFARLELNKMIIR